MKGYFIVAVLLFLSSTPLSAQNESRTFPLKFEVGAGLFAGNFKGWQLHTGIIHRSGLTLRLQLSEQLRRTPILPEEVDCNVIFDIDIPFGGLSRECPREYQNALEFLSGYAFRIPHRGGSYVIHPEIGFFIGDFQKDFNVEFIRYSPGAIFSTVTVIDYETQRSQTVGMVMKSRFGFELLEVLLFSWSPYYYHHDELSSWGMEFSFSVSFP